MFKRILPGLFCFVLLLALPFILRNNLSETEKKADESGDTLVIICAHDRNVRSEFERGFREYYFKKYGKDVFVDWRDVGGSSDIARYIDDRYAANFRAYYQDNYPNEWSSDLALAFANNKLSVTASEEEKLARERFLASNVGIGIDVFWGGGTYDQQKNADKGYGVDGGVHQRHPELFTDEIMPQKFSGEVIYDPQGRFYGICLSSFGICYNPDRFNELNLPTPSSWSDLGQGELLGKLAVGDPTKSGSVTKCYEMLVQQIMQDAIASGDSKEEAWLLAMSLLKKLCGNSMVITDSAGKIPREVSTGNVAAGICIDYYGFTESKWAGDERIVYVLPKRGSSLSADPIQLLRGAPNRQVAQDFIDYLLSIEGQKIWNYRVGTDGGPAENELRRPPVRRDMYESPYKENLVNPEYNPYVASSGFVYDSSLTARYFSLLRIIIRCTMLDPADELREAWSAIVEAGGAEAVPEAYAAFVAMPFSYAQAGEMSSKLSPSDNWSSADVAAMRRDWTNFAINQYKLATKLAKEGR